MNCLLALGLEEPTGPDRDGYALRQTPLASLPGYEILSEVARGAMGIVYRARQAKLDRIVALKVVSSGQFAGASEIARFRQEAEAAAILDHPNIVPIYHVGECEGRPFFTMPLIEGGTVAASRKSAGLINSEMPTALLRDAATVMAKVARAVHHAHQRGVLHRDLKPSNILLDPQGEPHITDFGLAKRFGVPPLSSSVQAEVGDPKSDLTLTGAALGTPGYMAPEQASGESRQVTIAADIFSLGAILYELLAGRPPFQADSPLATLRKTIEEDPKPPSAIRQKMDRDLETICLKCLSKAPDRRYSSAEALANDLESWLRHEPISARPPRAWERLVNHVRLHPIRAALTGVVALVVLLTATFFYASSRTYLWLMGKISDEHLIVPPGDDGVYELKLHDEDGVRCTYNFWKGPFWNKRGVKGRYGRIELTNVPPDLASQLQVRVFSDIPAMPDVAKTSPLTNGQIFFLGQSHVRERAFYFGQINFLATNVLARAPEASIRIILLGRPSDPDPYKPAGRLTEYERR
ncbi:MAG: serine/threonine protein kinase [Verrucomicrobiales bacterium]|nr:serine/threonine protein kinase [Verrucomicrobiales bacterium]